MSREDLFSTTTTVMMMKVVALSETPHFKEQTLRIIRREFPLDHVSPKRRKKYDKLIKSIKEMIYGKIFALT